MEQQWRPPGENYLKANWNATLDVKSRKMGIGVIIKNEKGEVIATCCDSRDYVNQLALAECLALRKAMGFCRDLSFNRVILEGDAQVIVNVVKPK